MEVSLVWGLIGSCCGKTGREHLYPRAVVHVTLDKRSGTRCEQQTLSLTGALHWQSVAMCGNVWQCVAVCGSVWQRGFDWGAIPTTRRQVRHMAARAKLLCNSNWSGSPMPSRKWLILNDQWPLGNGQSTMTSGHWEIPIGEMAWKGKNS